MAKTRVVIYGTQSCGACLSAIAFCKKKKIPFQYRDVSIKRYYFECLKLGADMSKIPHITVDKRYIGCYNSLKKYFIGA